MKLDLAKTKRLIAQCGCTRRWIAEKCGICLGSLHNILQGNQKPGKAVLALLAQALETTVEDLCSDVKPQPKQGSAAG